MTDDIFSCKILALFNNLGAQGVKRISPTTSFGTGLCRSTIQSSLYQGAGQIAEQAGYFDAAGKLGQAAFTYGKIGGPSGGGGGGGSTSSGTTSYSTPNFATA